jgi:hypothetical protein
MDFLSLVGFAQSGLLWIATGVSLLWIFRRIEDDTGTRLLAPVLVLQAVLAILVTHAIGMELFVAHDSGAIYEMEAMHFRLNGPYGWAYWLRIAANLAPLAFLVPKVRRSLLAVTGVSLSCFTVIFAGRLLEMASGKVP